jgi:hypothetical protein
MKTGRTQLQRRVIESFGCPSVRTYLSHRIEFDKLPLEDDVEERTDPHPSSPPMQTPQSVSKFERMQTCAVVWRAARLIIQHMWSATDQSTN